MLSIKKGKKLGDPCPREQKYETSCTFAINNNPKRVETFQDLKEGFFRVIFFRACHLTLASFLNFGILGLPVLLPHQNCNNLILPEHCNFKIPVSKEKILPNLNSKFML